MSDLVEPAKWFVQTFGMGALGWLFGGAMMWVYVRERDRCNERDAEHTRALSAIIADNTKAITTLSVLVERGDR